MTRSNQLPTVLMDDVALDEFLAAAIGEYQLITPDAPLPCFALDRVKRIHVQARERTGQNPKKVRPNFAIQVCSQ